MPVLVASIAIALLGLGAAAWAYGADARRAARLQPHFTALHRILSNKYYVDELYATLIGRPLYWISDRVFVRAGDRWLLDGALHGLAALGQRSAAVLARVQSGALQRYMLLVLAGLVAVLWWGGRG
jgi:NADH-quinone oxidoreductase subunit L